MRSTLAHAGKSGLSQYQAVGVAPLTPTTLTVASAVFTIQAFHPSYRFPHHVKADNGVDVLFCNIPLQPLLL